ncbi:hypothetical protein N7497_008251 [Penicillium chrysogenum]|uniref:HIRA-interacting protein n=1 Tax=Penicillium chrysogenum TaxID=5076 RepID=A0ABQ8WLR4_PENCH|nr:hypothetical protein N7524_012150 [Penicillium chrysogenum]KAJ5270978.1 hypothetical protein N7505_006736 [Penicillium chrysogenum]KAJ6146269.1 hypothetical protein N7497_008251 [Penicillium chrysogenum]
MPPKYTMFTMSDSESEAEREVSNIPSDQVLEKTLRDQVATIFKSGNMEELTVKRVRLAAEDTLGLTAGYFKSTGDWKARSENIIKDEVETQDQTVQNPHSQAPEKSPPPPKSETTALTKRAKPETMPKPRKRQKTRTPVSDEEEELSVPPSDESDRVTKPKKRSKAPVNKSPVKASVQKPKKDTSDASDFSGDESEEVTMPKKRSKAPVKKSPTKKPSVHKPMKDISDASDVPHDTSDVAKETRDTKDDSESEMSVVLDEEPQPKAPRKRQKSAGGTATKTKKKAPKAKDEDISPDQAEIRRLQGWLVKCGIRKLWGKELAPYDTPKAKIKHLKKMLEDAGMTGRPSQEKANQIREERELKADLEQIQEGAKQWGAKSDEEDEDAKPRRRLARGRQSLAFLESDGEETD